MAVAVVECIPRENLPRKGRLTAKGRAIQTINIQSSTVDFGACFNVRRQFILAVLVATRLDPFNNPASNGIEHCKG